MKATLTADVEASCVRQLFWRLLPFLLLLYVVNYLDRINVGFAALQMQSELGLSDRVYGLGAGIFFFGYLLFQVPSNLALGRVGARRWMAFIMILWGVVSCGMVLVRTGSQFIELRFLLGAAEAGFFPGVILYLRNWFPASARARAVSCFMTANPISGIVGGPISGALLGIHQYGIAGWRWMFVLEGLPAIVLALVVLGKLQDHPAQANWLTPQERQWLVSTLEEEQKRHVDAMGSNIWVALSNLRWRILLLTIIYFGITTSSYGITLWLPKFIRSLSALSNFGIGVVSVIPYIATAVAMLLVGMSSDRTGKHRLHLTVTVFSAAISLFAAAQTNSIVPALTFISLALMSTLSMQGPFWATATSFMSGSTAAAGIALINSFGNLGGLFGPYIIGVKRTAGAGFRGGQLVICVFLLLAGIVSLLVRVPRQHASPAADNPLQ